MKRRLSYDDYTVGWICALPLEMAASRAMMDVLHEELPAKPNDFNAYVFGQIGPHNVVIACLPTGEYGTASAATVATQLRLSFHAIRFGLLVGIGGGIPSESDDVRLGDVVVSKPTGIYGGVVQYDYGKAYRGHFEHTGTINRPPQALLTALARLEASHEMQGSRIDCLLDQMAQRNPFMEARFGRPGPSDHLFSAEYAHCGSAQTCDQCDLARTVNRPGRTHKKPVIHYGLIASGNQVVKDSWLRDQIRQHFGALCVEMEAAGLMNTFPCMVIRGICDYADSHKNKHWQRFAAAVAAAFAKELLLATPIFCAGGFHYGCDQRDPIHHSRFFSERDEQGMNVLTTNDQATSYGIEIDTNQSLTVSQRQNMIELLCRPHTFDHSRSLRMVAIACKARPGRNNIPQATISGFWAHPRFRLWQCSNESDVILLNGDYKLRLRVRSFLVNLIVCLSTKKEPIVWALQERTDGGEMIKGPSIIGVIRSLICQIFNFGNQIQTESDASAYYAQVRVAKQEAQWLDLLGKAISTLRRLYIVVERSMIMGSDKESPREYSSWVAIFLRLFDELTRRGCMTMVKVLIVNHSSQLANTEVKFAQSNHLLIPASRNAAGGRSRFLPWKVKRQ